MNKKMKKATLADIAKYAGVSRTAAGKVLLGSGKGIRVSQDTAEKIKKAAQKFNYSPNLTARQLAGKKSGCIGVLIDSFAPWVTYKKLSYIEQELSVKGYKVMIGQGHDDYDKMLEYVEDFYSRGIDGIISFYFDNKAFLKEISRFPNILLMGSCKGIELPSVETDISSGIEASVEHLAKRGHRKIGIILFNASNIHSVYRKDGYIKGLKKCSLSLNKKLVYSLDMEYNEESIDEAIDSLVLKNKADAIIAFNDIAAVSLVKKLHKCGIKVPEDVAVTGFDNDMVSWACTPSVTTVDQREEILAKRAVELLVELIQEGKLPAGRMKNVIKPRLIVRESTS